MTNFSSMKRYLILVLAFLVQGVAVSTAQRKTHQAAPHCSNSSLSGGYGFSVNGVSGGGQHYSLVGRFVADGKGVVIGTSVQSINGAISRPSFTGTYRVDTDCTGTATLTFDFGVAPLDFIIVDDGKSVQMIVAGANGSHGDNEVGTAIKQFNRH